MTTQDMLATVDLGSNSFRLQICHNQNGHLQVIDSIKEMVRLAAGLDEQKNLDQDSQQRALDCLARFGERLRGFNLDQVRVVATNTFRVAKNISQFIPLAEARLGFPIDIIAGREEARLIYTGVVHTLPPKGENMLVIDIGGGSTEFVIGQDLQPAITESLNLGCVSYSMRFFPRGKIHHKNFQAAVNNARAEIQRISVALKNIGWHHAIGTSGSARSIRDVIAAGDTTIDAITATQMHKIANHIIAAGSTKKAKLEGLKSDRTEVFAGGLAVMIAAFAELNISEMTVTDAALRDGVFYDMIGRQLGDDMRNQTIADFQQRYHVDTIQAERVAVLAQMIFNHLSASVSPDHPEQWQQYVHWAALVHEIGLDISHTGFHKHAAYILDQADMPGFSRKEQHILATMVLGQRGDLRKIAEFSQQEMLWLGILSLRLAALFCRARQDIQIPVNHCDIHYDQQLRKLTISLGKEWLKHNPLTDSVLLQESVLWQKIGLQLEIKAM
ncbi:exopolyphosphatase [Snodgrassella sp. W8132]|uniref:exopolyphosphatase n=1 Tax=Snodgrassella sp. W8132 TaxID=2750994 RepID=UPI0018DD4DDF|nr:exopolyphosphatase [Snodgrassella sp. W8132]MBI0133215.1 exopolyphosphatase [Snodgrassella sp. W8132]